MRDIWHPENPSVSHPRTLLPPSPNSLIFPKIPQDQASSMKSSHGSATFGLIPPFSELMLNASRPSPRCASIGSTLTLPHTLSHIVHTLGSCLLFWELDIFLLFLALVFQCH